MEKREGSYNPSAWVTFLGVGEAFDEQYPNTSILLTYPVGSGRFRLLLDCGFTAPPLVWRTGLGPNAPEAIWISHFHGDHFLGIPALLVRAWEEGRRGPLTFLGQRGVEEAVDKALEVAYSGFGNRIHYPVHFVEIEPGHGLELLGLGFESGESDHSRRNLSLRLQVGASAFFYSGDGGITPQTRSLARGCRLMIQEAFSLKTPIPGHGTAVDALEAARAADVPTLALVHIQRSARAEVKRWAQEVTGIHGVEVVVPEPGDEIAI